MRLQTDYPVSRAIIFNLFPRSAALHSSSVVHVVLAPLMSGAHESPGKEDQNLNIIVFINMLLLLLNREKKDQNLNIIVFINMLLLLLNRGKEYQNLNIIVFINMLLLLLNREKEDQNLNIIVSISTCYKVIAEQLRPC